MTADDIVSLVNRFTFFTMGCTDPVAIALATSNAFNAVGGSPVKVHVRADVNVFKDAACVFIPGTNASGIKLAAALGVFSGHPEKGLLLLEDLAQEAVSKAKDLVEAGVVTCEPVQGTHGVFVEATVVTDAGEGYARIHGAHDRVEEIARNGATVYKNEAPLDDRDWGFLDSDIRMDELVSCVREMDPAPVGRLLEGVQTNLRASRLGLEAKSGMAFGSALARMAKDGAAGDSIVDRAMRLAAAAADARMGGLPVRIMGCFGSGNHGIALTSSLLPVADAIGAAEAELARALALAVVIVGFVKRRTGILTPHCGCGLAAGTGAAAGVCYLLGGSPEQIENAANMVIGGIFGVLCDGAKDSCAIKISRAAGCAVEMGYAAANRICLSRPQGIVGASLAETLEQVETLTNEAWDRVDDSMVRLLVGRDRI